ncbi:hypothetical protein PIB30_091022 [Stylosanthes scabra]|uniref:Uncharacterized protein n=1 Tax=Stylosanthes scabra TaxID=79078 RepID=A0ABU6RVD5_9FABA|nr:hypothetical protein [Stylosanthes scabra]
MRANSLRVIGVFSSSSIPSWFMAGGGEGVTERRLGGLFSPERVLLDSAIVLECSSPVESPNDSGEIL